MSLWFFLLFIYPKMTLRAYLNAGFGVILLKIFFLSTQWINCFISYVRLSVSLGSTCAPSISANSKIYAALSLRRLVVLPFFLVNLINSLNFFLPEFPTSMKLHGYFRELLFSSGKSECRLSIMWFLIYQIPQEDQKILT